jgi:hypothetical protein
MMMILPAMMFSTPARAEGDAWTVMVYMDGDNNVESYAAMDLEELEMTGSSADVNIVVLWDPLSGPANLLYVNQGGSTTLAAWGEVNMGDPATLTRFIDDANALYPATRNALVMWNHGGGIMGLCWDDTSSSDRLTMAELRSGIANAGLAFDVLVFNACVMATAEVAHQVQGYASYVVFSQENMYALGFPYDVVAADLEANSAMDGRTMALMMAQDYTDYYISIGYSGVTISVYDMAYLGTVASAVNAFANAQIATMSTYYRTYKSIRQSVPAPNNAADLYRYAELVASSAAISSTTVKSAAGSVMSAVDAAIVYEWHTADVTGENGLGIWFPTKSVTYYWSASLETMYRAMPFDQAAGWANFLDSYYNKG